jgi:hypothetical protein
VGPLTSHNPIALLFTGNPNTHTPVYEMDVVFKIHYDYINKLGKKHGEVIQNCLNPNVCATGQAESMHRKYKGIKLSSGQAYN